MVRSTGKVRARGRVEELLGIFGMSRNKSRDKVPRGPSYSLLCDKAQQNVVDH